MYKTIFGFLLLIIGLGVIAIGLFYGYNVFLVKQPVPQIFTIEDFSIQQEDKKEDKVKNTFNQGEKKLSQLSQFSQENLQKSMEKIMTNQLSKLFPMEIFLKMLNMGAFSMFIGILIFGGEKIASLGIKLLNANKKQNT